jgi:hypothetical protein
MPDKVKNPKTLSTEEQKECKLAKGNRKERKMRGTSSSSGGVSMLRISGHGGLPLVAHEGGRLLRVEAATVDGKRWIYRC